LVKEGDELYKAGSLIQPIGENARELFTKVLELNPDDVYAKRRLVEIEERVGALEGDRRRYEQLNQRIAQLLDDADRYFQNGSYVSPPGSNARDTYREILRIDSKNDTARAKLEEIQRLLGDVVNQVEVLLAKAQVYIDLTQYIEPSGENAYQLIKKVQTVDPENVVAKAALVNMAADSIMAGDRAKRQAKPRQMKEAYLIAQGLGVDPRFLASRMEGARLMEKSRASVIIFDRKEQKPPPLKKGEKRPTHYLETGAVERRVNELSLRAGDSKKDYGRVFIDLGELGSR